MHVPNLQQKIPKMGKPPSEAPCLKEQLIWTVIGDVRHYRGPMEHVPDPPSGGVLW